MKLVGVWPGTVVSKDDPEKRGRFQVRIDQVFGADEEDEKIEDEYLPWVEGCFMPGVGSGIMWTPEVGSGVLISFWGGDGKSPAWLGGHRPSSDVIEGSDPEAALMRTPGGNVFEMRWKEGENRTVLRTPAGSEIALYDDEQGPRIVALTPAGRKLTLDDLAQKAAIETPTQKVEMLDTGPSITINTPGDVTVTGGAKVTTTAPQVETTASALLSATAAAANVTVAAPLPGPVNFVAGILTMTLAALALTVTTTLGLLITGAISMTAAGITLATTGTAIILGSVGGTKRALVMENFITDIYNNHTHSCPAGGGTTTNLAPPGVVGTHTTTNVRAD